MGVLIGLDIADKFFGKYAWWYNYVWYASDYLLAAVGVSAAIRLIRLFIRKKIVFTAMTLCIFFVLLILNIPLSKNLSGETTQQVRCALDHYLTSDPSTTQTTCFLGYPMRQYTMMIWPTVLWGRSLMALNAGGSIYFIIGLLLFSYGSLLYLEGNKRRDILVSIALVCMLHIRFIHHFLFYFEQSIFPLSFALMGIGLFFWYLSGYKRDSAILVMVPVIQHMVYVYTPMIAFIGLYILGLIYLLFYVYSGRTHKFFMSFLLFGFVSMFCMTLFYRHDVHIAGQQTPLKNASESISQTVRHILFPETLVKSYMSPVIVFVFIGMIVAMVSGVFGIKMVIIGLWILATFIISVLSRGYTKYPVDFSMHRSIVTLPVIMASIIYAVKNTDFKMKMHVFLVLYVFLIGTGFWYHFIVLSARNPSPVYEVIRAVYAMKKINPGINTSAALTVLDEKVQPLMSVMDYSRYFIPELTDVKYESAESLFPQCQLASVSGYMMMHHDHPCYETFSRSANRDSSWYSVEFAVAENDMATLFVNVQ